MCRVWVRILTQKCGVCGCHGLMYNTHTSHFGVFFCKLTKPQVPMHSSCTII